MKLRYAERPRISDDDDHDSMTDKEFDELLTKRMREKGIPVAGLRDSKGRSATFFVGIPGDTPEERSLEGWLDAKELRDEISASGRTPTFEDSFR
jgi:hypothetical protein